MNCSKRKVGKVNPIYRTISTYKDILPIKDSVVTPFIYTNTITLKFLPIKQKKKKFIQLILPSVLVAKHHLDQDALLVKDLAKKRNNDTFWDEEDSILLKNLFAKYSAKTIVELEKRVKTHPVSIVLAQAALESGWGTSDFFLKGNNIFGIWANDETKSRIKAEFDREGKAIYLKAYPDLTSSIEDYFLTIAKVKAYRKFRRKRLETEKPFELVPYLNKYSELGEVYTKRIRRIIKENKLTQYDSYFINPDYVSEVEMDEVVLSSL